MNTKLNTLTYNQTVLVSSERQFERFNELASLAQVLRDVCLDGERIYPGYTNMIGDVWYAFYSLEPMLDQASRDRYVTQFSLLSKLMQTDEYARWHTLTASDDLLSVLTAVSVGERLKELLNHNNDIREAQLKRKRAERSEESAKAQLKLNSEQNRSHASEQEKRRAKLQREFIQKQLSYAQQDKEQAENLIQDVIESFRPAAASDFS